MKIFYHLISRLHKQDMNHISKAILLFLVSCFLSIGMHAQTGFNSESEMRKQASKYFEEGDYGQASPLYSQLLSLYPKDPFLNYRCGVSFLYTESVKTKAVSCLQKSAGSPPDSRPNDVYYFLGKGLMLNNQIEEAMAQFENFKKNASKKELETSDVQRQIEMSKNAGEFLAVPKVIEILNKETVSREAYYSAYDLTKFKAKVIVTPENYRTALDKKKELNKHFFLHRDQGVVLFSSLGETEKTGTDLYIIRNFTGDKISSAENMGSIINSMYEEDYPYLTPDGKTLYFSSKGHNSMGGYDIFKSSWDNARRTWTKPENLGYPINSTSDDFFYVFDDEKGEGYFSTNRETSYDKAMVCKFSNSAKPLQYVLLNGKFNIPDAEKENNVRITAYNADQTKMVGILKPNRSDNSYSLALKSGKDFILKIEYPGYSAVLDTLPFSKKENSESGKREIAISKQQGTSPLLAFNISTQIPTEEELYLVDKKVKEWKEKSGNTVAEPEAIIFEKPEVEKTKTVAGKTDEKRTPKANLSNKEIVDNAFTDANSLREDAKKYSREATEANNDAVRKQSLAKAKESEVLDLIAKANGTADQKEKNELLGKANQLKNEAEILNKEAELLLFEAHQKNELATQKNREADFALNNAKELEKSSGLAVKQPVETKPDEETGKSREQYQSEINAARVNQQNLKADAEQLFAQAEDIKQEAQSISDEKEREKTLARAYNIEAKGTQRMQEAQAEKIKVDELEKTSGEKPKEQSKPNSASAQLLRKEGTQLATEADYLEKDAKAISMKARNSDDKEQKKKLTREAIEKLNAATEKRQDSEKKLAQAEQLDSSPAVASTKTEEKIPENIQRINSNQSLAEKDKKQIVSVLNEGNELQTLSENKRTESRQLANEAKTMIDSEEKKNTSRKAIQLMNESSLLQVSADEKFTEAKSLETKTTVESSVTSVSSEKKNTSSETERNVQTESKTKDVQEAVVEKLVAKEIQKETAVKQESKSVTSESVGADTPEQKRALSDYQVLRTESNTFKKESRSFVNEAKQTNNADKKRELMLKAMDLMKKSEQKQSEADEKIVAAGLSVQQITDAEKSETETFVASSEVKKDSEKPTPEVVSPIAQEEKTEDSKPIAKKEEAASEQETTSETETQREEKKTETIKSEVTQSSDAKETSAQYPDQQAEAEKNISEGKQLLATSKNIAVQANEVEKSAKRMANPADKKRFTAQANELRASSEQKKNEAEVKFANAEKISPGSTATIQRDAPAKAELEPVATIEQPVKEETKPEVIPQKTEEPKAEQPVIKETEKEKEPEQAVVPAKQTIPPSSEIVKEDKTEQIPPIVKEVAKVDEPKQTEQKELEPEQTVVITDEKKDEPVVAQELKLNAHPDYPKFETLNQEAKASQESTERSFANATQADNDAKDLLRQADEQKELSITAKKKKERKAAAAKWAELEPQAVIKQNAADSLFKEAEKNSAEAKSKQAEADNTLAEIKQSLVPKEVPKEEVKVAEPIVQTEAPGTEEVKTIVIDRTEPQAVYSKSNPIPINPKISEGLIFKVQIGAFRNPVDHSIFKGMQPIAGETTASGLTRYLAGEFKAFEPANWAKNEIRLIGYKDAFVVPYQNGVRISVTEAKNILAAMAPAERKKYEVAAEKEMKVLKTSNIYPEKYSNPDEIAAVSEFNNPKNPPVANVTTPTPSSANTGSQGNELYFTVQVGVYRNPETPENLKQINGLTKGKTPSGLTRYTSGVFNDFANADENKNKIVPVVKDAFVIAVYNGNIISVDEALAIKQSQNTGIPSSSGTPVSSSVTKNISSSEKVNASQSNAASNNTPANVVEKDDNEVVYKVQAGAFKDKVPFEIISKFLSVRSVGITNQKNAEGMNVFYGGRVQDFAEAEKIRQKMIDAGLNEALIVAFKGKKQITLEEAKAVLGK